MPTAGSPAKCQCCCVDRLCSRGENRGGPPPQGMEQSGRYLPGCFFMPPRKKTPLMLSGGQTVKGPRRVCACGRKESPIIFFGDMCGEENTSQAASVEFVRRRRTNYARSRLQPLCQKVLLFDSLKGGSRIAPAAAPAGAAAFWSSVGVRLQRAARDAQQRRQQQREHDAFARADGQPQRQRAEHEHR